MKFNAFLSLLVVLSTLFLAGCQSTPTVSGPVSSPDASSSATTPPAGDVSLPEAITLPIPDSKLPLEFSFASGAGGWITVLTLNADGSFEAEFHDSEMGSVGEGYPSGTLYYCTFRGRFSQIKPIDEHSWLLTLGDFEMDNALNEQFIQDGILYISSSPYGFDCASGDPNEVCRQFVLYAPGTPIAGLSEEFLSWNAPHSPSAPEVLTAYGLRNTETDQGFFSYPDDLM